MDNVLRSQLLPAAEVAARLGITAQKLFRRIQYLDTTENLPNLPFYFIDGQKTTENGEVMCRCRGIQGARGSLARNLAILDDALAEAYSAMYFKAEDIEQHERLLSSGELVLPAYMLPNPPNNSKFISALEAAREIKQSPVWLARHLRNNKDVPLFLNNEEGEEWPVPTDSLFYKIDDIEQAADMLGNFKLPKQEWYIHLRDLLADIEAQQNEGNVSAGEPETPPPENQTKNSPEAIAKWREAVKKHDEMHPDRKGRGLSARMPVLLDKLEGATYTYLVNNYSHRNIDRDLKLARKEDVHSLQKFFQDLPPLILPE